jgi:secreted trypsin-like serine protease
MHAKKKRATMTMMKRRLIVSILLLPNLVQSNSRRLGLFRNHKKRNAPETRIVGGTEATPGDYPFFGKLRFVYLIQRLFWFMDCGILTLSLTNIFAVEWEEACGAVLIHDDIILSAAHCNVITEGTVLVGAHRSFSNEENAEFRTIVDRRPHPSYHSMTLEYDFLVMKLDQAVSLFVCTKRK